MTEGVRDAGRPATGVKPGALTALLQEVAVAPEKVEAVPVALPPGTVLGRFEILRELGSGGFGVVYEARDLDLGRLVAVKLVRPGRVAEEAGRVSREAEAIARLSHPNLLTLHDVGRSSHGPYLVFELLRGKSLQDRMDEGPMPVEEAVHVATEVARGLAHAHSEGVVHRDLKPSNVFVTTTGQVKLLDFGMAHAFGRRRVSGGTPAYMAPEQWEDEPEDERTDVFALGVMLYRMLSGEHPFREGHGRWSSEGPPAPKVDVPGAPGLAELIARMLDRSTRARPRDGAAVLASLSSFDDALRAKRADGAPPIQARRRKATFGDLLVELRRRHVFRVMAGYGIFAFAVLQVTEPIMHGAHLPDWVLTVVLVTLVLGFPVAVVLAWIFDVTSRGVRRTPPAVGPGTPSFGRSRLLLPLAVAAAVLAIAAAGGAARYAWTRAAGQPRGSTTGASIVGANGRVSVAVADFANRTGEPEMDALSGLLITSLEQSRRLMVLTHSHLMDLAVQAGFPPEQRVDERIGREVGRRARARALLVGTIHRFGTEYALELRAVDPERDEYLFTLREQVRAREAIPGAIDRMSDAVRRHLAEAPSAIADRRIDVARAVTGSLDAYQHYFRGVALFEDHDFPGAYDAFQRALTVDPGMALAHVWLAFMATYNAAGGEEVAPHLAAAERSASSLPDKERRFVEALLVGYSGKREEAAAAMRELAADYPEDKVVHKFAGDFLSGPEREAAYRRALALDPAYPWPLYQLLYLLPRQGRGAEGVALAEQAVALRPTYSTRFNLARARGEVGDFQGALDEARKAQAMGPARVQGAAMIAANLAALGRLREAVAVLQPWIGPEVAAASRYIGLAQLGVVEALAGKRAAALRTFGQCLAIRDDQYGREFIAAAHAVGGDPSTARAGLEAWREPSPSFAAYFAWDGLASRAAELARGLTPGHRDEVKYRGARARAEGRRDEAVLLFQQALAPRPNSADAFLLGTTLAEVGRCAEAIPELDRLPRQLPWPWDQGGWLAVRAPLALLAAARCDERMGNVRAARERIDRLALLWKEADPELPLLAEAKSLEEKLGARTAAK